MRKHLSILLVICMFFTSVTPAFATADGLPSVISTADVEDLMQEEALGGIAEEVAVRLLYCRAHEELVIPK